MTENDALSEFEQNGKKVKKKKNENHRYQGFGKQNHWSNC